MMNIIKEISPHSYELIRNGETFYLEFRSDGDEFRSHALVRTQDTQGWIKQKIVELPIDLYREIRYHPYRGVNQPVINYVIETYDRLCKEDPDYQHPGPTNEELNMYPALKEAWNEFIMVRALCGVMR